jgi:hypothetical protein
VTVPSLSPLPHFGFHSHAAERQSWFYPGSSLGLVNGSGIKAVLLTGVYGSGKSTVAKEMAYLLEQAGELTTGAARVAAESRDGAGRPGQAGPRPK